MALKKCISAASSCPKSYTRAKSISPKGGGSKTVAICLKEKEAIELAMCILAVSHDRDFRDKGKIIITGHKDTNQVTVLRKI